ncbi:MAG: hypothetical protein HKL98_03260 [Burkholderiales bacterium]|nr:hypothetical protein [Burkholderiales bacterium]
MDSHAKYFYSLIGILGLALFAILAMNLKLMENDLGGGRKAFLASSWQEKTRGVTYAPPLSSTRLFKTLRLNDRLPHIDTVIFGSSTAMGARPDMFPGMKAYNFAQTGNLLLSVIGEAQYIQKNDPEIRNFVIPLDWSLDFLYMKGTPSMADLSEPKPGMDQKMPPFLARMKEAMSEPRIKNLSAVLISILKSHHKWDAAKGIFLDDSGRDYRCADGEIARDYDTMNRGTCTGFRYDGSATFGNLERVKQGEHAAMVLEATIPSSKYSKALMDSKGEINPEILKGLSGIVANAKGKVILFMPPLLPGMEKKFMMMHPYAEYLAHTKKELDSWAKHENVTIVDAGESEKYGCTTDEFVDQHHAVSSCYQKIFEQYFRQAPDRKGIYAPN